jgi:hypothetical protein
MECIDPTYKRYKQSLNESDSRLKIVDRILNERFRNLLPLDDTVSSNDYYVNDNPNTTWRQYLLFHLRHEFGLMTNQDVKYLTVVARLAYSDDVRFDMTDDNAQEVNLLKRVVDRMKKNDALFQEVIKGNIDDEISVMSLLLYFSKLERFTEVQKNWIIDNVEKFVDAGKILPFFKNFASFIRLPQDIFLKTYLVYKSDRQRQVYVKYSFDTGTRTKMKTERTRLEEVVSGVYVLEFVVFHGERLVYSIEDDPNGNAKIDESEVLKKKTYGSSSLSRFERINSMLVKQEMRKDKELLEDLDVYINTVHLFEENLKIL